MSNKLTKVEAELAERMGVTPEVGDNVRVELRSQVQWFAYEIERRLRETERSWWGDDDLEWTTRDIEKIARKLRGYVPSFALLIVGGTEAKIEFGKQLLEAAIEIGVLGMILADNVRSWLPGAKQLED